MHRHRVRSVVLFVLGLGVMCSGLVFGSWSVEADRDVMCGVTVILTLDGDFEADGQRLDFGPMKKWTPEFVALGGPGALVNFSVDLAGIWDGDGNFEVYRAHGEIRVNNAPIQIDLCTRMAGRPTGPRGSGGTPCPGSFFDLADQCD